MVSTSPPVPSECSRPEPPIATVTALRKRYGDRTVVNDLSFELQPGTITGFVGPNGAGKTTTIRALLGLVAVDSGRCVVNGGDLSKVGALIDGPAFYPALSAERNLRLLAVLGGLAVGRVPAVLEMVGLADRAKEPLRTYSLGMRQRLGIAAALLPEPVALFLDEPTNGLDPQGILDMRALLRRQADAGTAVLISSHLLSEVESLCDRLVVIRGGTCLFSGPLADLERRQRHELVAVPEHPGDLDCLAAELDHAGYSVAAGEGMLRIASRPTEAAAINRLAFDVGITLSVLQHEREGLEATFLRMVSGVEA